MRSLVLENQTPLVLYVPQKHEHSQTEFGDIHVKTSFLLQRFPNMDIQKRVRIVCRSVVGRQGTIALSSTVGGNT